MAKKRALGRGLSNLLPGASESGRAVVRDNPDYEELALTKIHSNPNQPRKSFPEKELEELAASFHSVGLIEPVVVRRKDDAFELISGERRWRAAKMAGYKKIPAVIKQVNDIQALEMGIIENIQREELNPLEEARAYEFWMQQTGQKASDLAKKLGRDRTTVTNLVRLLKLPEEVLHLLEKGMLTPGQARPLLSLGDRQQLHRLSMRIAREGWTARKVEDEVARVVDGPQTKGKGSATGGKRKDANVASLEKKLRTKLSAKVEVQHKKGGGGKISIHYGNLNDLDRLLELLKVR